MDILKGALKSKTVWFSGLVATFGFLEQHSGLVSMVIGPAHLGIAMAAVGGVNLVLRAMTDTALSDK